MTATQLLQAVGPELRDEIITYIQTQERAAYRVVIQNLSAARRLRPVFVQKKTKAEQAVWVADQLKLKSSEDITAQLLQIWLIKGQQEMLVTFLDAVGIEHDGKGEVQDLPEEIEEDKADAGVAALMEKFPAKKVALYLFMFQLQKPDGWDGLKKAIEKNPELKLEVA
ncbi:MAG: hypothetical protein KDK99_18100 [Verrucomicrobiales bacterium]|nr:hypothetical protein [Verrucomicrobiales bacterium]